MDRDELMAALTELADLLARSRVTARVYIVGGAAMVLAYDAERSTRDIDGLILEGHGPVTAAVREIARRRGLPSTWLNKQAAAFIPAGPDKAAPIVFDHPALRVLAASPERLLAMKVMAARRVDIADIEQLAASLDLTTATQVIEVFVRVLPDIELSERSRLVITELFDD